MNRRFLVGSVSSALCIAAVVAVLLQQHQLTTLRAEQQQLATAAPADEAAPADATPAPETTPASPELLRLRGEVTRLAARRRELNAVSMENRALQNELAVMRTNSPTKIDGPKVTLKMNQAAFSGYDTPEATLQTVLFAMRQRDLEIFLTAFTPESAQHFRQVLEQKKETADQFFEASQGLQEMTIAGRRQMPDGSQEFTIQSESVDHTEQIRFRQINGEWRLTLKINP